MLHRLSLATAMAATTGVAWTAQPTPLPTKTDLVSIYREAVNDNTDLVAAQTDYLTRKEMMPQVRAGLLPQLGVDAHVRDTQIVFDKHPTTARCNSQIAQAALSQPLFHADRWPQRQTIRETSDQVRLGFSVTQQDLILCSAETYLTVLRAQGNLATNEAREVAFKRQLDQTNGHFSAGLSDKTNVLETQVGYDTVRANRLIAEQRVDDAFQALVVLTNRNYSAIKGMRHTLLVVPPAPNDVKARIDTVVQQNLRLLASNYTVNAAEETLHQRKAEHPSTFDVVAQYQKSDNDALGFTNSVVNPLVHYGKHADEHNIGLELNISIYSGGLAFSQVRKSCQRLNRSEQSREGRCRQVVQDTHNPYRTVNIDAGQAQARRQAIIPNQSSLEATGIDYQIDTRNIVDVLNVRHQPYTVVRDYNNSRYDYILDVLCLRQATGTLSLAGLETLDTYLKQDYDLDRDFLPPGLTRTATKQLQSRPRQQYQHEPRRPRSRMPSLD